MMQSTAPQRRRREEGHTRNGPRVGEGEQGTIFGTSSNTVLGTSGAAALPQRSSSRLEAGNKRLTVCGAGISEAGSRGSL